MKNRFFNKVYAWLMGYYWIPCPICGKSFGGHEEHGGLLTSEHEGISVCYDCKNKAEEINKRKFNIEIKELPILTFSTRKLIDAVIFIKVRLAEQKLIEDFENDFTDSGKDNFKYEIQEKSSDNKYIIIFTFSENSFIIDNLLYREDILVGVVLKKLKKMLLEHFRMFPNERDKTLEALKWR